MQKHEDALNTQKQNKFVNTDKKSQKHEDTLNTPKENKFVNAHNKKKLKANL